MELSSRQSASAPSAAVAPARAKERWFRPRVAWMAALIFATCFEGLGRKYLTFIPQNLFFFVKDAVLIFGLLVFGIRRDVRRTAATLYRGFVPFLAAAVLWTVLEVFNPEQVSFALGLVGLRGYWLWWIAPLVIASALEDPRDLKGVVIALAVMSMAIAAFAMVQFAAPSTDALNMQLQQNQDYELDVAIVAATGKARVSSTFSYLAGFADFTILVPPLLLTIGLNQTGRARLLSLIAAVLCAAALPTSGSRAPMLMGVAALLAVGWGAGLLKTRIGRRAMVGGLIAVAVGAIALPEAIDGVMSRFAADTDETTGRFQLVGWSLFPPWTMHDVDFPALGIGTGMMQNARGAFGVAYSMIDQEQEPGRYLMELGSIGYLLMFTARLGLVTALVRAYKQFRKTNQGAYAGLAVAYAGLIFLGGLSFDHVWAALHFTGIGLLLRAAELPPVAAEPPPTRRRAA